MKQADPMGKTVCRRDSGTRAYMDVFMACLPHGIGLLTVKVCSPFLLSYLVY